MEQGRFGLTPRVKRRLGRLCSPPLGEAKQSEAYSDIANIHIYSECAKLSAKKKADGAKKSHCLPTMAPVTILLNSTT